MFIVQHIATDDLHLRLLLWQAFHRYVRSSRRVSSSFHSKLTGWPGTYYPSACGFIKVTFNFTVTSAGTQFVHLVQCFLMASSYSNPSSQGQQQNDLMWSYLKDLSIYLAEFKLPPNITFRYGSPRRQHIHRGLAGVRQGLGVPP